MNQRPGGDAADVDWLDDLLVRSADTTPAPADDGFTARAMHRVDAVARAAAVADPAACIAPATALRRLPSVLRREQRRQSWTTAGVLAAAGIGLLTLWAQPGATGSAALVLASVGLLGLLLRDPQF